MTDQMIDVPGKFTQLEEAVLKYLYEFPYNHTTYILMNQLRPERPDWTEDQKVKAFEEIQYAIETLVAARLAKGKRFRDGAGRVYFEELKLTNTGEAEAIRQERRLKKIVIDMPRPD